MCVHHIQVPSLNSMSLDHRGTEVQNGISTLNRSPLVRKRCILRKGEIGWFERIREKVSFKIHNFVFFAHSHDELIVIAHSLNLRGPTQNVSTH